MESGEVVQQPLQQLQKRQTNGAGAGFPPGGDLRSERVAVGALRRRHDKPATDGFGSVWTFLALFVVVGVGLACMLASSSSYIAGFACCLPPALAGLTLLLINRSTQMDHLQPDFCEQLERGLAPYAERARSIWLYERERARSALTRANISAVLWGAVASLSLIGAAAFVRGESEGSAQLIALTVIGAVATRFMIDLGSIAVRISNTDVTRRMFAEAVRGLIGSLLAAGVLVMLLDVLDLQQLEQALVSRGAAAALGLGCAVAFIGSAAFDWVQARLRVLFGMGEKLATGGTPLTTLEDIGETELERLREEGIRSVEALIATSVPRLFFGTRFSLQRIIGWHDRGLLLVRLGTDAARELGTRWGLRGCIEVLRAYESGDRFGAAATLKAVFQKTLRVDNEAEAEMVVWQIVQDDRVKLVQVMHHTLVEQETPAE